MLVGAINFYRLFNNMKPLSKQNNKVMLIFGALFIFIGALIFLNIHLMGFTGGEKACDTLKLIGQIIYKIRQ
jgi:hypothetical protein